MFDRVTTRFNRFWDRFVLRLPPRAQNPYLTHFPVLWSLGRLRKIESVLEFGCGEISTKAFLNRDLFPHLKKLTTYENDQAWAERVKNSCSSDDRLEMNVVTGLVARFVPAIDVEQYDVIFIDDSVTARERSQTIDAVAMKSPKRAIVVIHDFETRDYRIASRPLRHRVRMTGQNPNTGVLWNGSQLTPSQLRQVDHTLRSIGEINSVEDWVGQFRSNASLLQIERGQ